MRQEKELNSLTGRVARGTAWIVSGRLAMRVMGLVNTIIVARLLAPEDFGLVAVALTAMQLLQGFSDIGVAQTVVRFDDAGQDDLDTLFTLSLIRGLLIGALLAGAAPLAGSFYGDGRLTLVFLAIAAHPVILGFVNPRFFEFERKLDFSKEFVSSVVNKLLGVAASITIAVIFRSYWAIVAGILVGGFVQMALSYLMRPHLPRFTFASVRKVFGFSGWLTGISFIAALNNKLDTFILARVIGVSATGTFYLGSQLSELPTSELASPIARAIYPGLSELKHTPDRMRLAYLRGVEALGALAMPASLGFAFIAHDFVEVFLGEKWHDAVLVVQILTPVLGLHTLFIATQFYAMALGMARLVFFRELIYFIIKMPVFIWATVTYGFLGAVWAVSGLGILHIALNTGLYARATGRNPLEPFWSAHRSLFAAAVMAAYFLFMRPSIGGFDSIMALLRLAIDIGAGALVYGLAHLVIWRIEGMPDGVERVAFSFLKKMCSKLNKA